MAEVSCKRAAQENIEVVPGKVPSSQGTVNYSGQRWFSRCLFYILGHFSTGYLGIDLISKVNSKLRRHLCGRTPVLSPPLGRTALRYTSGTASGLTVLLEAILPCARGTNQINRSQSAGRNWAQLL